MNWVNEKRPRYLCVLCVRVRKAARARAMRGGVLRVLRVLRVVRVVRARQLPSPGPRAPQVMFTVGEAQVHKGGKGFRSSGP